MKEYELDKSTGELIWKDDKPLPIVDIDRLHVVMDKVIKDHGEFLKNIKD